MATRFIVVTNLGTWHKGNTEDDALQLAGHIKSNPQMESHVWTYFTDCAHMDSQCIGDFDDGVAVGDFGEVIFNTAQHSIPPQLIAKWVGNVRTDL